MSATALFTAADLTGCAMRLAAENLQGRTLNQRDGRIQPVNAAITSLWRDDPKWHQVIEAASNDVLPMIVGELNGESFIDRGLDRFSTSCVSGMAASVPIGLESWDAIHSSGRPPDVFGQAGDWGAGLPLKSLISWTKRTALRYTISLPGCGSVSARRTARALMRVLTSASSLKTRTWI